MVRRAESCRRYLLAAILVLVGTTFVAGGVKAKTTVTTYSYNTDGALTAITTQEAAQDPITTYLTWDNFRPNTTNPTTGTVSVGNGRLVARGETPGAENATESFTFDPRDRLLGFSRANASESYDYHAGGMMLSASTASDDLLFYYDHKNNPQATNVHQTNDDLWSAYLDRNRYLEDGTEETLLKPRKDMAATYDAKTKTLRTYAYDSFGADSSDEPLADGYDLRDNPFRYAGVELSSLRSQLE